MSELNKFTCILCNKVHESKEQLNVHFRLHADQSTNKTNATRNGVQLKDTVPCDVCSQEFKTISLAIQHKYRKHPDAIMKFFCKFCGMQFPLKTTHDKHLSTHDNETARGDFPCLDCNATFVTENGRRYHIKSAHNRVTSLLKPVNTPPPSKKIRLNNANEAHSVYYCYLCGVPYINKYNLQRHLEKNHTEMERDTIPVDMLKCTTCDALFYTKQAYDSHAFDHKPDDLYVTSEEQRLQTVARVDQDFDIRRVQLPSAKFIPTIKPNRKAPMKVSSTLKVKRDQAESDDELSPTSEIESSSDDDEPLFNHPIRQYENRSKNVIVKKRLYGIIDANGLVTQTCKNIPKNAILARASLITLKNSDVLKTLNKTSSQVKVHGPSNGDVDPPEEEPNKIETPMEFVKRKDSVDDEMETSPPCAHQLKVAKVVLDRLPEQYERILLRMRRETSSTAP